MFLFESFYYHETAFKIVDNGTNYWCYHVLRVNESEGNGYGWQWLPINVATLSISGVDRTGQSRELFHNIICELINNIICELINNIFVKLLIM